MGEIGGTGIIQGTFMRFVGTLFGSSTAPMKAQSINEDGKTQETEMRHESSLNMKDKQKLKDSLGAEGDKHEESLKCDQVQNSSTERIKRLRESYQERIETLERELANCKTNEKQIDSELTKYKTKYRTLKAENNKLGVENTNLMQKDYEIHQDLRHVESRYEHIIKHCLQPYAEQLGTKYDDTDAKTLHIVLDPLFKNASEAQTLRDQVQMLQKEMLAKMEKVQAVTDDRFARDFHNLASTVKALSRRMPLIEHVDVAKSLGAPFVEELLPSEWFGRCKKKCFMEIYIWSILLHVVFRHPFMVLGQPFDFLERLWKDIFKYRDPSKQLYPSVDGEVWRYTTMEAFVKLVGRDVINVGESGKVRAHANGSMSHFVETNILQNRANIMNIILAGLDQVSQSVDLELVQSIIDKAFSLALQMSVQRARVQVTYPEIGTEFNKEQMSCLGDADGEEIKNGIVGYVVNPGLTKWGDALGKDLNIRYDIVSSLVQTVPVPRYNNESIGLL